MRTTHLLGTLVALTFAPAAVHAQGPTTPAPSVADELPPDRKPSPVHFLLFGVTQSALIRTAAGGPPTEVSTGLSGVEATLQSRGGGIGIAGRLLSGSEGLEYMDGSLLIGSRKFSIDAAYVTRTGFYPLAGAYDSTYKFARGGFRSRINLGNAGFTVSLRGGYYVPIPSDEDPGPELEGWEGETGVSWTWSKFPLSASLGYRIERFLVWGVEQEVSALTMGAGVAFGRR